MNQNGYNSQEEQIIDVPYYTRGLSDGNNLRISRRIIRAQNVINYRRNCTWTHCICNAIYKCTSK